MKTTLRLMFAIAVLAGLALPAVAVTPKPINVGSLNCLQFCMVALCPPGGCGAFVDPQGVTRCGCLGTFGVQ